MLDVKISQLFQFSCICVFTSTQKSSQQIKDFSSQEKRFASYPNPKFIPIVALSLKASLVLSFASSQYVVTDELLIRSCLTSVHVPIQLTQPLIVCARCLSKDISRARFSSVASLLHSSSLVRNTIPCSQSNTTQSVRPKGLTVRTECSQVYRPKGLSCRFAP